MDPKERSANSNSVAFLIDTQLDNHIQACGAPALVPPLHNLNQSGISLYGILA